MSPDHADSDQDRGVRALRRLLAPSSIAIVGLSDTSKYRNAVAPTLDSDADLYFIHPRHETVMGRSTYPSLSDVGRRVDAVVSYMSAERSTELVEEAARLDVGGVVLVAGGFAEVGRVGEALQERVCKAAQASGMAI